MARAKAAQAEKTAPNVGVIKHQNVPKEKLSKMERRRRLDEARLKEREARRAGDGGKNKGSSTFGRVSTDPKSHGKIQKPATALKDRESGYKGTARPAPSSAVPTSSYKGTSGLASRRPPPTGNERRRPRQADRYLDTDEEDIDDDDEMDEDEGGHSDASSDMEAGVFDVDMEEQRALRAAKKEDEEELRLENRLKSDKEKRKRALEALQAAKARKK